MKNAEIHSRLVAVEKRLDEHIHDGIGVWQAIEEVKTDVKWIRKALWALVGLSTTIGAFLVKFVLFRVING